MQYTTSSTPWVASQCIWYHAKGCPSTGSSALGHVSVSGHIRVPSPPARITHCMGSVSRHQLGAFVVETEADFAQALLGHGFANRIAVLGVQQEESTAARAHQCAA